MTDTADQAPVDDAPEAETDEAAAAAVDVAGPPDPPDEPDLTLEEALDVLEDEVGQLKMRGGDSAALQDALKAIRKATGTAKSGGDGVIYAGTPLGDAPPAEPGAPKLPVVPVEPEALSETVYRVDKPPATVAPASQDQPPTQAATADDNPDDDSAPGTPEERTAALDAGATPMTET